MLLIMTLVVPAAATVGKVTKELEYRDINVTLDGKELDLRDAKGNHVEPFMFEGTNYLPVRALAESLGLNVSWNGQPATVVLTTDAYAAQQAAANQAAADAAAAQQQTQTSRTVYITKTGSKYHYSNSCNGGTYYASTLAQAQAKGLKPCDKCT